MSNAAIEIRSDLLITPQQSGGGWKFVVEDPVQHRYFRLGSREYLIASSLDGRKTLEQIVDSLQSTDEGKQITLDFLQKTLRWLASNGLLKSTTSPTAAVQDPSGALFQPKGDPFTFRIAMISSQTLNAVAHRLTWLCSRSVAIFAVISAVSAIGVFFSNSNYYTSISAKLFVPEAMAWWLGAWLILKVIHELGHAVMCVANRGTLRGAGLAFIYLAPVPYVDTTDMWKLADRRARILCACGGMLAELVLASLAVLVCSVTESTSLQYFCMTIATLGTFTTLAFNGNPLARFDGYYLASDLLDRPNLWTEGQTAFKSFVRCLFVRGSTLPASKQWYLAAYGMGCMINRVIVMLGLAWGAWAAWKGIGLAMMAFAGYLWFYKPWKQKRRMALLCKQPGASSNWSSRRIAVVICCFALSAGFAWIAPSPWQAKSPGVIQYHDPTAIRSGADGILREVFVADGEWVEAGKPLLRLENPTLVLNRDSLALELAMTREKCNILRASNRISEAQSEQAKEAAMQEQLEQLNQQVDRLTLTVPVTGRFQSRQIENRVGQMVKLGQAMGWVVDDRTLELMGSVAQQEAEVYRSSIGEAVALHTQDGREFMGTVQEVLPSGSEVLENVTLAAKYGGPITVRMESSGREKASLRTEHPRFAARIAIESTAEMAPEVGQWCTFELKKKKSTFFDILFRLAKASIRRMTVEPPDTN